MSTTNIQNSWGKGFTHATRIQQSFTANAERRALLWLAARTPACINSDHLTALALIAQLAAGAGFAMARWSRGWLVLSMAAVVANWLGDSLDGTLARFRNQQRPRYGFYVDHICDVFGAAFLMLGLALSGLCDWRVALGMLLAFLVLSAEVYLASYTLASFRMSYSKFGPTEIRILLIAGIVRVMFGPYVHIAGYTARLFDLGGVIAIAGMTLMAMISTILHTRQLYREETRREPKPEMIGDVSSAPARCSVISTTVVLLTLLALSHSATAQPPPQQAEFWRVRQESNVTLVLGTGGECQGKVVRRVEGELSIKLSNTTAACGARNALVKVREANTRAVERAERSGKKKAALFAAAIGAGAGTGVIAAFVPVRGLFGVLGGGGVATHWFTKEAEKDKPAGSGYVIYVSHLE